ncbi:NAD(P)-binding protein [Cryphonectria parasitica EP155]|uniref:NAD(P)-binding protein n=1 Tax=Cryphonectria parasitica (strain ATCC 38755 / EP155) TaxID=660469 RepID=A0A9P5CND1_CRYP1|nr:NAD(P)-binding protein [Cryphonectria parasitica EP155]KAF3765033.1 NAD(P)-binding protein [Cryphonectria parasitica EP155]
MSTPKVLLIFGAGPKVGLATVKKFSSEGYKVAAVSRHPSEELKKIADLIVPLDLKDPTQIQPLFENVTKQLGPPHVVVYNAFDVQVVDSTHPLQVSTARLTESLAVNVVSPYTAAVEAVRRWKVLPDDGTVSKTFLFTGNMSTTQAWPFSHSLGIGKNGTAYWLETAAATYKGDKHGRFYYVDERGEDGESVYHLNDAAAHADEFWKLSEEVKGQSHWNWTFVKGKGYVRNRAAVEREFRGWGFDLSGYPEGGFAYDEFSRLAAENEDVKAKLAELGIHT